jgi:hypothetical protein
LKSNDLPFESVQWPPRNLINVSDVSILISSTLSVHQKILLVTVQAIARRIIMPSPPREKFMVVE